MTRYNLAKISEFSNGALTGDSSLEIHDISFDSRRLVAPKNTLFVALKTEKNDGHNYVESAFEKGVRAFLVHSEFKSDLKASFIRVKNTLRALQLIGKSHRESIEKPVIAITGSNGKTTVKEWLSQILNQKKFVYSSPRSYNSQIGVPLSLWRIRQNHDLSLIEAGISEEGEMERLKAIIQPTFGVFTNIGDAHLENFDNQKELIVEKAQLFKEAKTVIVSSNHSDLTSELENLSIPLFKWGHSEDSDVIIQRDRSGIRTVLSVSYGKKQFDVSTEFNDFASLDNLCHVITACLLLETPIEQILTGVSSLQPLDLRMQVQTGINNCVIINDTYTADIMALQSALDLAHNYSHGRRKVLIISDFPYGRTETYLQIKDLILKKNISQLITIGMDPTKARKISHNALIYATKDKLLENDFNQLFADQVIIIKGARKYRLETIAKRLQLKDHQTVLEINLNAFNENLNYYQSKLNSNVKVMAMVKAFSYGAGSFEVASHLESLGVNYLAVAYADEGVELRKAGIQVPILVLNPEPSAFENIIKYNLEPEIYSLQLLRKFQHSLLLNNQKEYVIHLKLDTGMHRLGIETEELEDLFQLINLDLTQVKSIFSHLAGSENQALDDFTRKQIEIFKLNSEKVIDFLGYSPLRHICNSAAISRFPEAQFDMVRLGIGLYGISSDVKEQSNLRLAGQLKSTIIQIRTIQKGETIGYGRSYIASEEKTIGIIPVGYADGLSRVLGHEKISVTIGNQTAPILGTICMDMAFIDITQCEVGEGDEVVIFKDAADIWKISNCAKTIPYEVLARISNRVKRDFYLE